MGASKKLMEDLIMSYSEIIPITTARFANVAFSNGSLLFGYKERLAKGQPLSCPSDIKRFFVSPEESGQICMLACILGQSGNIFFPKLEESQMEYFKNITDRYIEALGYKLDLCSTEKEAKEKANNLSAESDAYPVYYFSTDTSGEKLYEEFYSDKDKVDLETFSSLGVIKNATIKPRAHVVDAIGMIEELLSRPEYDKNDIVKLINKFIPDFSHIETGKSLDDKM
jgi:FlaA1/EpsC-like NDP-sugar epimerase